MYRIVIVDDERMIREGIEQALDWPKLGIGDVLTAISGREALSLLRQHPVDILLTDLNMSGMTGLQLIEQAASVSPDMRILVLTGYDYFEYARKCLRMHVADFLLKPIDEKVLASAIASQVHFLDEQKAGRQRALHGRRRQAAVEQLEVEGILKKLVHLQDIPDNWREVLQGFQIDCEAKIQAVILLPEQDDGIPRGETTFTMLSIKNICLGLVDAMNAGLTFMDDDGHLVVTFLVGEDTNETMDRLGQLLGVIKNEYGHGPRAVVGSVVSGFADIHTSYSDARYLLEHRKQRLWEVLQTNRSRRIMQSFRDVHAQIKDEMHEAIDDRQRILELFEVFAKATRTYNLATNYVRSCCFDLLSTVFFAFVSITGRETDGSLAAVGNLLVCASTSEALSISRSYLKRLFGEDDEHSHMLVSKAKALVDTHLTEDLSVASIAEELHVSPNYFSRLFKRVAKVGCNEYIVRKRIAKACDLLVNTNLKAGRIAYDVGYHDTNYFSLAFKKHMGMSPTQYRKSSRTDRKRLVDGACCTAPDRGL